MMTPEGLARVLEQQAVAGRIVTPVSDVYRKMRMFLAGDPRATFGLAHLLPAEVTEITDALRTLTGAELPPEGAKESGRCFVDPGVLVSHAEEVAKRLRVACERGDRVLFGTGHPAGPIELYARLARAMSERGADVMCFAEGETFSMDYLGRVHIRYVADVACLCGGGELLHTHSPRPMEYLLDVGPTPDLVVGDHGFAGVGLGRGADCVAVVDTNDPALILAWARGGPISPLVCDDNRPPSCYRPLADFLLERL